MSNLNLKIEVVENTEPGIRVRLAGELDQLTVDGLRKKLAELNAESAEQLVIDLEGLEFMASAGLSVLAYYHELYEKNGKAQTLRLLNVPDHVMRMLQLTRMDKILQLN
ncbi:MAG: hypothetical protein Kow0029_15540 [Candidatus Rifleibacteriota bacterium]